MSTRRVTVVSVLGNHWRHVGTRAAASSTAAASSAAAASSTAVIDYESRNETILLLLTRPCDIFLFDIRLTSGPVDSERGAIYTHAAGTINATVTTLQNRSLNRRDEDVRPPPTVAMTRIQLSPVLALIAAAAWWSQTVPAARAQPPTTDQGKNNSRIIAARRVRLARDGGGFLIFFQKSILTSSITFRNPRQFVWPRSSGDAVESYRR